ncbi:MAG: type II toxin-antitoxin system RelE/ParE family toxin [Kiritimatiellae bacterium]|nr:type II toxin-antitoxin system RelE/ParE family toxin [Kiritimatiellia bacterium]
MTIVWSPHARGLLHEILSHIREVLSSEDSFRWFDRICDTTRPLAGFPNLGPVIPTEYFDSVPPHADRLRQVFCKPYRIVCEAVDDEIHILSIRHSRMLVTEDDTTWN